MPRIVVETPLGWCGITEHDGRLERFVFPCKTRTAAERAVDDVEVGTSPVLQKLAEKLAAYFRGEKVRFLEAVNLDATPPFHRAVLMACREIRYGEVRTYGWLAHRVGRPAAARAVGQAMAHNPVPIVIPCHRVLAAGGKLGGYGGGLATKRRLLEMEGSLVPERTLDLQ